MQLSDASERAQRKVIEKSSVWMYGVASKHRLRKCDGVAQKNTRLINSIYVEASKFDFSYVG